MVRKPVIEARISRWLMDTGSGLDLVSKSDVRNMKHMIVASENPVMLATANGVTSVDEEIALRVEALDETIKPFVLESTPSVLTVGWRCMELGYEFRWPARSAPTFTCPDGRIITLDVEDYVPYLNSAALSCAPATSVGEPGEFPTSESIMTPMSLFGQHGSASSSSAGPPPPSPASEGFTPAGGGESRVASQGR